MRHLHLRKRVSRNLEPYPSSKFWIRVLDRVVFTGGVIGPVMTIPQLMLIYGEKDASGVSAISWFAWAGLNIPWILYGFVHKETPIVITYTLWFCTNLIVAVGAVLYG